MTNPIIKIAVPPRNYAALETLAQSVYLSMLGNLDFPTPAPTLVEIQNATNTLSAAMTKWGTPGHRGSHTDLLNLRIAATALRSLLLLEAAYVMNLVDLTTSPLVQQAFIAGSGFEVKDTRSPQGMLEAPQNVHQLIQRNLTAYTPKIKWKKPTGLTSTQNVKVYNIFRGTTASFAAAVNIGTSTKTFFIDQEAPRGTSQYYFVAGVNTNGLGVASSGVLVLIPN